MILLKESKENYRKFFKDFFDFFNNLNKSPPEPFKPFQVVSPQDLSSFWKCFCKGGAAKRDGYFCHCCSCHSNQLGTPRHVICKECEKNNISECYHWPVGDLETLQRTEEELTKMKDLPEFNILLKVDIKKMKTKYINQGDPESDIASVDYVATTEELKALHYNKYLKPDLQRCGLYLKKVFS